MATVLTPEGRHKIIDGALKTLKQIGHIEVLKIFPASSSERGRRNRKAEKANARRENA